MASIMTDSKNYENIAETIRLLDGTNKTYYPYEMPNAIKGAAQNVQDLFATREITSYKSDITYLGYCVFYRCDKLVDAQVDNADKLRDNIFRECRSLKSVSAKGATDIYYRAFYNCGNLVITAFDSVVDLHNADEAFKYCKKLTSLKFPKVNKISGANIFADSGLTTLILGAPQVCTLEFDNIFRNTPIGNKAENAFIYVPKALIEQYKVAPNWVTFADRFKAIEDGILVIEG